MFHCKLPRSCTFPIVFRGDDANCPCSELFSIANWAIIMMQFAVGLQYIIILGFSRACLGKIIIFKYEWLKKTVFHHVKGFGKSNQQCHRDLLSNFKNGFLKSKSRQGESVFQYRVATAPRMRLGSVAPHNRWSLQQNGPFLSALPSFVPSLSW